MAPCPRPPLKADLIVEVNKEIGKQYGPEMKLPEGKKTPDVFWLLVSLATLTNRQHHFFAKDFVPVRRGGAGEALLDGNEPQADIYADLYDNDDEFWTDLPDSKNSKTKFVTVAVAPEPTVNLN